MASPEEERLRRDVDRLRREVERIESSRTYRFSKLLSRLASPIHRIGKSIFGRRARLGYRPPSAEGIDVQEPRDCVLFIPTNGVGMGHFTRLLAIARRMADASPSTEIVFCTTASTLHVSEAHGFASYRIPGRYRFEDGPSGSNAWNTVLEDHLGLVLDNHRPRMTLFDGASPYRGLLDALSRRPWTEAIWVRRGMHKAGTAMPPKSAFDVFSTLVHPGDAVPDPAPAKPTGWSGRVIDCPPIVYATEDDLLPRDAVRRLWGIDDHHALVYVSLGAGRINDIESDVGAVVSILQERPDTITVLGESLLGDRILPQGDDVRVLRDYPNVRYAEGFDLAIIAGGYNSYHEMVRFGVPTICIPNQATQTDDQLARAEAGAAAGHLEVVTSIGAERLRDVIDGALGRERGVGKDGQEGTEGLVTALLGRDAG